MSLARLPFILGAAISFHITNTPPAAAAKHENHRASSSWAEYLTQLGLGQLFTVKVRNDALSIT